MKKNIIGLGIIVVLMILLFSYKQLVKENVVDNDDHISYLIDGEVSNSIPNVSDINKYTIEVNCTNEVTGYWDKITNTLKLSNITSTSQFKCNVLFMKDTTYLVYSPSPETNEKEREPAYFLGKILSSKVQSIEFLSSKTVPNDALGSFDVSSNNSGEIMAWYYDKDSNGLYEVYVGQDGGVKANSDSSNLFQSLINVKSLSLNNLDTSNVTNMSRMFSESSSIESIDLSNINTINVTNMASMFNYCSSLTSLDLSRFDTSNVTDMSSMFYATPLGTLNVSNLDTKNVRNMSYMFAQTYMLSSIDISSLNTQNVRDMSNMFMYSGITSINLTNLDTSKVENMSGMFALSEISSVAINNSNTKNVTNMSYMFSNCSKLTNVDFLNNMNTSNVTTMSGMFQANKNLVSFNITNFDTSKVEDMSFMFSLCSKLTSLNLTTFNTANVTTMTSMFANCTGLKNIDVSTWNTTKVIDMGEMFYYCSSLTVLDLSSFVTPVLEIMFNNKIYDVYYDNGAFFNCTSLTHLYIQNMTFDSIKLIGRTFRSLGANTIIYVKDSTQATKVAGWNNNVNTIVDCSSNACP